MVQYMADINVYTSNDSGSRSIGNLAWIIFHTTENSGDTTAQDVARYQQSPSAGGSYNVIVDKFGTSVRSNDDNYIPWAAGSDQANDGGLHISIVGQAAQAREVWLRDYDRALRKAAEVVAKWSTDYGIPLVRRSTADLIAGVKGIAGHNECSQAFGGSDHWDPGTGFPYDVVIGHAQAILDAGNTANPAIVRNEIDHTRSFSDWLGARLHDGERRCKDTVGRYADFEHGSIYWHPNTGSIPVPTLVYETWKSELWEQGFLGYPTRYHVVYDGLGDLQEFQGGTITRRYGQPGYVAHGVIGDRWRTEGDVGGPLGWPTSNEYDSDGGRRQDFDGGSLHWHPSGAIKLVGATQ